VALGVALALVCVTKPTWNMERRQKKTTEPSVFSLDSHTLSVYASGVTLRVPCDMDISWFGCCEQYMWLSSLPFSLFRLPFSFLSRVVLLRVSVLPTPAIYGSLLIRTFP